MSKEQINPFNKEDELRYQAWAHGYNSTSKEECPYEEGMLEADVARPAWMRGFNANKTNKASKNKLDNINSLENIDEKLLLEELKKRRLERYNKLLKAKAELEKQIEDLRVLF